MPEEVYDLWVGSAAKGTPPHVRDVARIMLDLMVPWFWNDHFIPLLEKVGEGRGKHLVAREVARGHGKTSLAHLMTLYAACFVVPFLRRARATNRQILLIGRDEQHAKDILEELHQTICEYAPWLKFDDWELMGDVDAIHDQGMKGGRTWNKTQMSLTNGVKVRAFSIMQNVRRFHCYMAVVDDLQTEDNLGEAEKYVERLESALRPAIEYGGVILVLGTPQDDDDVYGVLSRDPRWDYVQLRGRDGKYMDRNLRALKTGELPPHPGRRAYSAEDLKCLWPWRMDALQHDEERGDTRESQLRYEREIMLQRVTLSNTLIDINDLYAARDPDQYYVDEAVPGEAYAGGVDPSALSRSDAAICMGTADDDGVLIPRHFTVIEALGDKRPKDSTLRVTEKINEVSLAFGNPYMHVEQNQFQEMIAPVSEKHINPGVTLIPKHLGAQKHTEVGWVGLRTRFANRKVRLPYGPTPEERRQHEAGLLHPRDFRARVVTDRFIAQVTSVRVVRGQVVTPKGRKDDMVSAFYQFVEASKVVFAGGGGVVSGGLPTALPADARRRTGSAYDPELDHGPAPHADGPAARALARMRRTSAMQGPRTRSM